jgi:hypothetical protein
MMIGFLAVLGWMWMAPPCETGFCYCGGTGNVPTAVRTSGAVFTGTVVAMRDTTVPMLDRPWRQRAVTLRVDRAWKGVESETVIVLTRWGGGDCGFPFEPGESYLVYAHGSPGEALVAGTCGRTAELSRAAADVRALGEPAWRSPPPAADGRREQ